MSDVYQQHLQAKRAAAKQFADVCAGIDAGLRATALDLFGVEDLPTDQLERLRDIVFQTISLSVGEVAVLGFYLANKADEAVTRRVAEAEQDAAE